MRMKLVALLVGLATMLAIGMVQQQDVRGIVVHGADANGANGGIASGANGTNANGANGVNANGANG